ncbi:response regulator [Asticcacaulis sp. EMRT-3]|uniref:response regulator n=1 Tax=Asticcacaulis sp. EMRT-3 TaxID=3040349 RepID=UPI0024AF440C|nr:response regulator [Asticcacaulis sp. EMRT-3]MDI7774904.1 response regulator [Asticcacaulis sp. EMRT-3]
MADYSSLKILLIEDNQHMRSIVSAILNGSGIRHVREARDGAEGLDLLRQYPADIALVDFNMDPIDGVEFTRMLRNAPDSSNPYLPVVMITGHSERSRVMQARDSGVNEFVVKPLTARALLGRLDSVIMRPRPFIRCKSYFGPDRRRKSDQSYPGPYRRNTDAMA